LGGKCQKTLGGIFFDSHCTYSPASCQKLNFNSTGKHWPFELLCVLVDHPLIRRAIQTIIQRALSDGKVVA